MPKTGPIDVIEILLEAHKRGQERAIDDSIRSGVPLVVKKMVKSSRLSLNISMFSSLLHLKRKKHLKS